MIGLMLSVLMGTHSHFAEGLKELQQDIPSMVHPCKLLHSSDFPYGQWFVICTQTTYMTESKNCRHYSRLNGYGLSITAFIYLLSLVGEIYLWYSVDIHKKYLMNNEFNTSCLVDRRIINLCLSYYFFLIFKYLGWICFRTITW